MQILPMVDFVHYVASPPCCSKFLREVQGPSLPDEQRSADSQGGNLIWFFSPNFGPIAGLRCNLKHTYVNSQNWSLLSCHPEGRCWAAAPCHASSSTARSLPSHWPVDRASHSLWTCSSGTGFSCIYFYWVSRNTQPYGNIRLKLDWKMVFNYATLKLCQQRMAADLTCRAFIMLCVISNHTFLMLSDMRKYAI